MEKGKLIIFSAPSGSGKSSVIQHLLQQGLPLQFSISATSRAPRGNEQYGVDYYFLTPEEFRSHIKKGDFLEYEEVYKNKFYGTLKSEVERITKAGQHVVFDMDVVGGCNIKKLYGDRALSIFIRPPSVDELRRRLKKRGTDAPEVIENRLKKAAYELRFAAEFDVIIINDELAKAQNEVFKTVKDFIDNPK
jgi:guanylate kinase